MSSAHEKLLQEAKSGENAALQKLLLAHFEKLSNFLSPRIPDKMRSTMDAEDILQNTFVQVFRDFSKFDGDSVNAFFAWIKAIAEARLVDAIRSATRLKRGGNFKPLKKNGNDSTRSYLQLLNQLAGQDRSPSQLTAAAEVVEAIQIAIASLPDEQRLAIQLRYLDNLPLRESAQQMGCTENAVRGLLHRAKANLKTSMGNSSDWLSRLG